MPSRAECWFRLVNQDEVRLEPLEKQQIDSIFKTDDARHKFLKMRSKYILELLQIMVSSGGASHMSGLVEVLVAHEDELAAMELSCFVSSNHGFNLDEDHDQLWTHVAKNALAVASCEMARNLFVDTCKSDAAGVFLPGGPQRKDATSEDPLETDETQHLTHQMPAD